MADVHLWEVVVDCADPDRLGEFYAALCDCELHRVSPDWTYIEPSARGGHPSDNGGVRIAFQQVPEPKVGKVRLHLDFGSSTLTESAALAVELGATVLNNLVEDHAGRFIVLADPEGHEFCLVDP